jgi:hypothetical protein
MHTRRKTQKKGGGPKRKTAKKTAVVASEPSSPEKCPICMENLPKNAPKTTCGHRFHKKCLMGWCETHPLEPTCPNCREPIPEDCNKMQPGKFMPPHRIDRIMKTEEYAHNMYHIDVGGDILEKKREMLKMLKFPTNYTTSDWTKINHFSEACRKSINYEAVRDILAQRDEMS